MCAKWYILAAFLCAFLFILFPGDAFATSDCVIEISTSGAVGLSLAPGTSGVTTASVTAATDCAAGYKLYISGPADANLYSGGNSANENYISAVSGTKQSPTALSVDTYGYSFRADTLPTADSFIGLTNEPTILVDTEQASAAGGDTYIVSYGASVATDKPAGSYTMANNDGVAYTIIANLLDIITISFDAVGGTIPAGQDWTGSGDFATKEITLTTGNETYGNMPEPTKEGYTFLGWTRSQLPEDYQEVEYIESTGTQYIDTGVPAGNTKGAYAEVQSSQIFDDAVYFGSRQMQASRFWVGNKNNQVYFSWNYVTYREKPISTDDINVVKLNYLNNRKEMYGDEVILNFGSSSLSSSNNKDIYIFAGNDDGVASYWSSMKLYNFKISEGSEVEHEFIPCYRKSDGEIGLYDIYEERFYTNAGESVFGKGNDSGRHRAAVTPDSVVATNEGHTLYAKWGKTVTVSFDTRGGESIADGQYATNSNYNNLPTPERPGYIFKGWVNKFVADDYIYTEWLESNGKQYIDTGVVPTNTMGMYGKLSSGDTVSDVVFFGVRKNDNNTRFWIGNKDEKLYFGWNSVTAIASRVPIDANMIFEAELNFMNSRENKVNGVIYESGLDSLASIDRNIYVFAGNNKGTALKSKIRLYEFKISVDDAVAHNYVPCYRLSDDVAGLYDTVAETFVTNPSDTGTFNRGTSALVDENTAVTNDQNHTLYALWEEETPPGGA